MSESHDKMTEEGADGSDESSLPKVSKGLVDLFSKIVNLQTPIGGGDKGQTNGISFAVATAGLIVADAIAVIATGGWSEFPGLIPDKLNLSIVALILFLLWGIVVYVFFGRVSGALRTALALNFNLLLVWIFISIVLAMATSYMIGNNGNVPRQALCTCVAIAILSFVQVWRSGLELWKKGVYWIAITVSMFFYVCPIYSYTPGDILPYWQDQLIHLAGDS
jgi:hypothetical protein